ncbi:hypothetical protein TTHERM_00266480 (macronuclear) [Tetrahymena thermophila SB210]|uniref:Uncharacterized protein n=1 Tax=Tetrahymena thermophila (strain SB210) TaxID=312017 RepID=I7MIX7_TETTS|nr:hypothetical protein TTHERM_00266480 [Tetrahymena thermophila SB210]EAR95638.2 hypothetical protein TTHERM_00266480 [Tetrahymena thermophila SB210]|eukprot:XP_001015883.2 hypothetical protein TTHERM_00266480 [Tetrahymena thermophila SB210]
MVQNILKQKFQEKIQQLINVFEDADSSLLKEHYRQQVLQNDTTLIETIIQTSKQVLQNNNISVQTQFQTISFLKECVDTWNTFLIQRLKQEIVPVFYEILKSTLNHDRTNQILQSSDNLKAQFKELALHKNLIRLISECIFIWSKWFTQDKILITTYNELVHEGFTFPKQLTHFNEIDILYLDVEQIGAQKKICIDEYIFVDNDIYFEQFVCHKQGKLISSNLLSRSVSLIDDKLYQIDTEKGIQMKKIIPYPDYFFLQERAEYLQLKGCKVSKQNGIDLKLNWDHPEVDKLEWRLLCKRGSENRCYAIYFTSKEIAVKVKDYIHFIKAKSQIENLQDKFKMIAMLYKSKVAEQFYEKRIQSGDQSTSGSFQNDSEITSRIDEFLGNIQSNRQI